MGDRSKTARFSDVVNACGRPEALTLWTRPEANKAFMAAVRQQRVLTVRQQAGSRKDYGVVGFVQDTRAAYLVFPRALTAYRDRVIVGIKYDLVDAPGPVGQVVTRTERRRQSRGGEPLVPRNRLAYGGARARVGRITRYKVVVRFTATREVEEEIEADTRKDARQRALKQVKMPDMGRGTVTSRVVRIREE